MGVINKPYTYSANTTISSSKVNANEDTIYNEFNGSISAANLASDAVTTAKIADSNVTTAKIADDAVTPAKIASDAVTAAKMLHGLIKGRVGGDASAWGTTGTTGYDTSANNVLIQTGSVATSSGAAATVTFQTAFSQNPVIIGSQQGSTTSRAWFSVDSSSASSFTCSLIKSDNTRYTGSASWVAIGPA